MGVDNFIDKVEKKVLVTDMVVPTEKKDIPISDPEGFIDEEVWAKIAEEIEFYRQGKDWRHFAPLATSARLLFPELTFDLGPNDQLLREMKQGLFSHHDFNEWHSFSLLVEYCALFYRDSLGEMGIDNKLGNEYLLIVKSLTKGGNLLEALRYVKRGLVIWPDRFKTRNIEQYFKEIPLGISHLHERGNDGVKRALECAALGYLLFPQKRQELNLGEDFFNTVRDNLTQLKQEGNYYDLLLGLLHLAIITYPLSKIDSAGQIIIRERNETDFHESDVSLPIRREF